MQACSEQARQSTESNAQQRVGQSLCRLGRSHEPEHITPDGLFSTDLAIVDRRIVLEFDGPSHFTRNTLEPLGHTRLRDRLLSAMGWHVVSIPFFAWDRLHQTEQRDAYVKQRLLHDPAKRFGDATSARHWARVGLPAPISVFIARFDRSISCPPLLTHAQWLCLWGQRRQRHFANG